MQADLKTNDEAAGKDKPKNYGMGSLLEALTEGPIGEENEKEEDHECHVGYIGDVFPTYH